MFLHRPLTLCFCLLLSLISVAPCSADAASDARKAIQANYNKLNAALAQRNLGVYRRFYTKDAWTSDPEGERLLKKKESMLLSVLMLSKYSVKITTQITKFALQKDKAIVTVRENMTLAGQREQDGEKVDMKGIWVKQHTWLRSGGGWKIGAVKRISAQVLNNGQPLPDKEFDSAPQPPKP
jgi:ketosteroid isomerase-like protein